MFDTLYCKSIHSVKAMSVSINVGQNAPRPQTMAGEAVEFMRSVPYDGQERTHQLGTTPTGSSFEMKVRKDMKEYGYEASAADPNPEYGMRVSISYAFLVAGRPTFRDNPNKAGKYYTSSNVGALEKDLDDWLAARLPEKIAQAMA
jgi:hypothetical protein